MRWSDLESSALFYLDTWYAHELQKKKKMTQNHSESLEKPFKANSIHSSSIRLIKNHVWDIGLYRSRISLIRFEKLYLIIIIKISRYNASTAHKHNPIDSKLNSISVSIPIPFSLSQSIQHHRIRNIALIKNLPK